MLRAVHTCACKSPDWEGLRAAQVVGVKSREILLNAGNIHCITQQQPAAW